MNDVAIGQAGEFYFLRGRDGARLYRPIEVNRVVQDSAAVADFGPGYGWRLIVQSWHPEGDGLPKDGSGARRVAPPAQGARRSNPRGRSGGSIPRTRRHRRR